MCQVCKTFATVVCRLGRQGTKGKCWCCKRARCGHENQWIKELKASDLKTNVEKGISTKETSSSSENDDDGDSATGHSQENEKNRKKSIEIPNYRVDSVAFFAKMNPDIMMTKTILLMKRLKARNASNMEMIGVMLIQLRWNSGFQIISRSHTSL